MIQGGLALWKVLIVTEKLWQVRKDFEEQVLLLLNLKGKLELGRVRKENNLPIKSQRRDITSRLVCLVQLEFTICVRKQSKIKIEK